MRIHPLLAQQAQRKGTDREKRTQTREPPQQTSKGLLPTRRETQQSFHHARPSRRPSKGHKQIDPANAVRGRNPPHKSIRRDSIVESWLGSEEWTFSSYYSSPCYSYSPSSVDSGRRFEYPVRDQYWRPTDRELPWALRQLVDAGRTSDMTGLYIVAWLHKEEDSRFAGLVDTLVKANKPYWEITVRLFRTLDLKNDHGHPLHSEVELGDLYDVPYPRKPIQRGFADAPELIAPSNMGYPLIGKGCGFCWTR
ncbi:uncharacterized protein BDV17DRAFT_52292 [Aspergillus undulatus]|uniref:uncharacterized protein n=1 Tax=Aspergillus undulatus TaxID=1810928 RepID=UPI003CCDD95D